MRRSVRVREAISKRFGLTHLPQGDLEGLRGRPSSARLLEARQQVTKMAGAAQPHLTVTGDRPGHFTLQQPERTPESARVTVACGLSPRNSPVYLPRESHNLRLCRAVTLVSRYLPF